MASESIAHMRPKAEWAIDSEAMRARGIIVLVKFNSSWSKISRQNNFSWQNTIQPPLLWFSKLALFTTSGI